MAVKTSAAFTKAVMKPGRDLTLSMVIGASKDNFDVANILSIEIIESASSKKGVQIGQFCKNECKLTVLATAYDDWQGNTFQPYIKIAGIDDKVSLGRYYVYEVNTDDNYKTVVTAYDIPSWWTEAYSIKDTSVSAILTAMESKSGQTIVNKKLLTLADITEVPEKATNQDMLAYIAGYDGYSVRTNRDGNLELYKYELPKQYGLFPSDNLYPSDNRYPTEGTHVTQSDIDNGLVLSQDRIFQSGLKVAKTTTDINSVTISNGTDNYTIGNGYGITYHNPYIKSAEQADKCASYLGFRYSAMTVKYIGNPALQAGDTLMVEVAPDVYSMCLIMEQKISFDGGLGITIDCYSDEADTLAIGSESPTMKKVEAKYNELQTLIADMTKTLMGSERGYYRLLAADFDSTGGVSGYHTLKKGEDPAGFRIMNTPEYTSTTHGWQFTLQGLWFSNDGFKSFTNDDVGLTMDGKLLANLIRANSIIGGVLRDLKGLNYWNLDTGELHLSAGTKVGASTIANKADISASSEAITATVSKTYTTKADAQTMADTAEANAKNDTADKLKSYSTTVEMQSAIKQQADSITATVSKTYTTKADAQNMADTAEANAKNDTADKLKSYSTTVEMQSAIKQQADSITATVSKTYTTKADAQTMADTAEANAKNDTADKLKSYSTTVEMQSAIKQQADSITATVSKTYQTMDGMSAYTKKAEIIADINGDTSEVKINADKIEFTGSATFNTAVETAANSAGYTTDFDLTRATADMVTGYMLKTKGQTIINGDNITTGTINCNLLNGGIIKGQVIQGGTITGTTMKTTKLTFGDDTNSVTVQDADGSTKHKAGIMLGGAGEIFINTDIIKYINYTLPDSYYTMLSAYDTTQFFAYSSDDPHSGSAHIGITANSPTYYDYGMVCIDTNYTCASTITGSISTDNPEYSDITLNLKASDQTVGFELKGGTTARLYVGDAAVSSQVNRIWISRTASEFYSQSGKQMFKVDDDRIGILQSSNDKKTWKYIFWATYSDGGFHVADWNANIQLDSDGSELYIKAKDTNNNYSSYRVRWVWLDNHWVLCAN